MNELFSPTGLVRQALCWAESLTETKIQDLYDHVGHNRFHIVEMGCQIVQLLSADILGQTMFVNSLCHMHFHMFSNDYLRMLGIIYKMLLFKNYWCQIPKHFKRYLVEGNF